MKALIAMSGGVDSSVAAKFMINEGFECVGCTMLLHDANKDVSCGTNKDIDDAESVAKKLSMDFKVCDYRDIFKENVIDKFVAEYKKGHTPNPCVICNKTMKFDRLFSEAKALGCDLVVTGHYVRSSATPDGKFHLYKALDESKDQSYVLYQMTQDQLKHVRFPLGEISKDRAREIAEENGFINADKPDSQDICFVPDGDYASVIERYSGEKEVPGDFVDMEGHVMGTHKGITHYTIGQRKGLGLALKEPAYVQKLDVANNRVILGSNEALFKAELTACDVNWIAGDTPKAPFKCRAKIRYKHKEADCTVTPIGDDRFSLVFDEPQRAITPGQSAVLYLKDEVLGGGIIE